MIAVTGAASGIGLALARLLAQRGAKLSIADVTEDGLKKAAEELRQASSVASDSNEGAILAECVDVRDRAQVTEWIAKTISKLGRLDCAANVAGVLDQAPPEGVLWHESDQAGGRGWDWVLGVNLTGVANCMRAELKHMAKGASIVNITSIVGLRGARGATAAYTVSKHGVVGLTRFAAIQYGPHGIRINAVAPGPITTPMTVAVRQVAVPTDAMAKMCPIPRAEDPEEVAKVIMFLLSDDSSVSETSLWYELLLTLWKYVTGSTYGVDGGMGA